jgi:hypothetical protein
MNITERNTRQRPLAACDVMTLDAKTVNQPAAGISGLPSQYQLDPRLAGVSLYSATGIDPIPDKRKQRAASQPEYYQRRTMRRKYRDPADGPAPLVACQSRLCFHGLIIFRPLR